MFVETLSLKEFAEMVAALLNQRVVFVKINQAVKFVARFLIKIVSVTVFPDVFVIVSQEEMYATRSLIRNMSVVTSPTTEVKPMLVSSLFRFPTQ